LTFLTKTILLKVQHIASTVKTEKTQPVPFVCVVFCRYATGAAHIRDRSCYLWCSHSHHTELPSRGWTHLTLPTHGHCKRK